MQFVLDAPVSANDLGNAFGAIEPATLWPCNNVVMPLLVAHFLARAPGHICCVKRGDLSGLGPKLNDVCGGGAQPQVAP